MEDSIQDVIRLFQKSKNAIWPMQRTSKLSGVNKEDFSPKV